MTIEDLVKIKKFLKLNEKEINRRLEEERKRIPKVTARGYLGLRIKRFETSECGLIKYLAQHNPELLTEALDKYSHYAGDEAKAEIIENMTQHYIFELLLLEKEKKKKR